MNVVNEAKRKECISLILDGLTNVEINKITGLSTTTISTIRIKTVGYTRKSRKGMKIKRRDNETSHYQFKSKLTDSFNQAF